MNDRTQNYPPGTVVLDPTESPEPLDATFASTFLDSAAEVMAETGGETREVRFLRWLADQIEAQTRPPKPAEPTGLGAVVEDAGGVRWVRLSGRWHSGPLAHSYTWRQIDAVRVLSEGVSA